MNQKETEQVLFRSYEQLHRSAWDNGVRTGSVLILA